MTQYFRTAARWTTMWGVVGGILVGCAGVSEDSSDPEKDVGTSESAVTSCSSVGATCCTASGFEYCTGQMVCGQASFMCRDATITMGNVCRNSLGKNDPSCNQYCTTCGANRAGLAAGLATVSTAVGAYGAGTGFAQTIEAAAAGTSSFPTVHNCAVSITAAGAALATSCLDENCLTSNSAAVTNARVSAACAALSCIPPQYQVLASTNPYYIGLKTTCALGPMLAKYIACGDYTLAGPYPLQGAAAACQSAIDAAAPIGSGTCPVALRNLSVRACNPPPMNGPRSDYGSPADCAAAATRAGAVGRDIGACAAICVANTAAASVNCPPPPCGGLGQACCTGSPRCGGGLTCRGANYETCRAN